MKNTNIMTREEILTIVEEARKNGVTANLNGADLRGVDLSQTDLSGADLEQVNLFGVCLEKTTDLNGATFD